MIRVTLEGVRKAFGSAIAVRDLDLDIEPGSFFAIVGPSGCGKTTTMRMIAGLERPDTGRIRIGDTIAFDGASLTHVGPARRDVGLMFQSYALWPHMTVFDNVSFGARVRGEDRRSMTRRVGEVLDRLQIAELVRRFPNELSGGQQQRVALARELVTGASVLLMDEPLSNLDARLRMDMRAELKRLHAETGKTIIYVTHDQFEALTLSTSMAVMHAGEVQQIGTPHEIYHRPVNAFVSEFIGLNPTNFLDAALTGHTLQIGDRPFELDSAAWDTGTTHVRPVLVGIRPENVHVETGGATNGAFPGTVEAAFQAGPNTYVQVSVTLHDRQQRLTAQTFQSSRPPPTPGSAVGVHIDVETMFVFDAQTKRSLRR
jgi:ABC-type sugar transport system ATPase subunit